MIHLFPIVLDMGCSFLLEVRFRKQLKIQEWRVQVG